jgi:hypothetical protein
MIGSVQKYLVNEYFSPPQSYEKVLQVSLALICYWYQKFHSHFFFQQETDYWKEMIESLGMMLNKQDSYSLVKFDKEGNFHDL